jgi:hypothetical protein
MAITLTQDTYRLWARIGYPLTSASTVVMYGVTVAIAGTAVAAQLAQLLATQIANEAY